MKIQEYLFLLLVAFGVSLALWGCGHLSETPDEKANRREVERWFSDDSYPEVITTPLGIKMLPVEDKSPFLVRLGNSLRPTLETSAAGTSLAVDKSGLFVSGGARTDDFASYARTQWEDFNTGRTYALGVKAGADF